MKQPKYTWDPVEGCAYCTLYYNNKEFYGVAFCHPDDKDMQSRLTGQTIAEYRALKELWRYRRDCELRPQLKILKQLYYSMNRSKKFAPFSYENKMLQRQIRMIENDLATTKEELADVEQKLKHYISIKENCYQALRKLRKGKDN